MLIKVNMAIELVDLPEEILFEIIGHIRNIRTKIVLLRVCRKFNETVRKALQFQQYSIESEMDYICPRKIPETLNDLSYFVLPLRKLLSLAPQLTHFVDHHNLITTFNPNDEPENESPFNLQHTVKLSLEITCFSLAKSIRQTNNNPIVKMKSYLDNCSNLRCLSIRFNLFTAYDEKYQNWWSHYHFSLFLQLETIEIVIDTCFLNERLPHELIVNFFGICTGQTPNLKAFSLTLLGGIPSDQSLLDMVDNLSQSTPKLQVLKLTLNCTTFLSEAFVFSKYYGNSINSRECKKMKNLKNIHLCGLQLPQFFVSQLLSKAPNLKNLVYNCN